MTFQVGQKVVCWNADWPKANYYGPEILPQKDEVYTIRDLLEIAGRTLLRVNEIRNPVMDYNFGEYECAFHITRFRPIVEPKTEVSFTIGADPSTDQFDNRRKVRKKVSI